MLGEPRGTKASSGKCHRVQSHLSSTFVDMILQFLSLLSPLPAKKLSKSCLVLDDFSALWGKKKFP